MTRKAVRKKLIEVALPLEAINAASAREKSIRHGHPSTLHLWWARRPLAACRAVLFAQLVDDPSSVPEEFPDERSQKKERRRLFRILEELVRWENSNNERVISAARREIARSVARTLGEKPPCGKAQVDAFLAEKAPPVVDPFCGGGSIPLEAQRLGLRSHGSDLNPVAVLITKALVEIPPKFAGVAPVNPQARSTLVSSGDWTATGPEGLAEDVRYYARWMRDEADGRIGHLYPNARLPDGSEATVVAWLWVRTVASPNPAVNGVHVPLASTFVLSSKKSREAIVVPVIEQGGYRFVVKASAVTREELNTAKSGTKVSQGSFVCTLSGAPILNSYIDGEANAGRMRSRLMAVVAKAKRGRIYLSPNSDHEAISLSAQPSFRPEEPARGTFASNAQGRIYGFKTFGDYFTNRQLVALTTFSDLITEAHDKVKHDYFAMCSGLKADQCRPLPDDGQSAQAYADAVATYLAFALDKLADRGSSLCTWFTERDSTRNTLARQALPMTWDFAEVNPLLAGTGSFLGASVWTAESLEGSSRSTLPGSVRQRDAGESSPCDSDAVYASDPPYYDNIAYADLSDFFYVWLRRTLGSIHPKLFKTLLTPKTGELVVAPYRFGGDRGQARRFFEAGLGRATAQMRSGQSSDYPMTMFYAYKQAETQTDATGNGSTASTGWETMLTGLVSNGFAITGTWPVRSELSNRMVASRANALASSIVLACRPRTDDASVATRRDFVGALKGELPAAIRRLQTENIAPVDLAQAAIGPGMAVFSRYSQVLEADGGAMPVRQALVEINRVLDETLAEAEGDLDADTRFCVAWFEQYGTSERAYGEAEVLFTAKNTSFAGLEKAGVLVGGGGKVRLKQREELEPHWEPATDDRIADWECVQHLVRAMTAESGGGVAEAARLAAAMGSNRVENARAVAYRLYTVSERKGWTGEALAYNILVTSWPQIQAEIARQGSAPEQSQFDL